jgi:uncharacterized protein (DUF1697 family)
MNLKMADLKSCLEAAGFGGVKTILSSGNVAFDSKLRTAASVEKAVEAAMQKKLSKVFTPFVRSIDELERLLEANPFSKYKLPSGAKRVVTFLREPAGTHMKLPVSRGGARIYAFDGREIFTAYTPSPEGPVFMKLIEENFGKLQTTRTWDTLGKCAKA